MERKETVKVEVDPIHSSSFSTDPNSLTDMLEFGGESDHKSSLGFMELLGIQDFSTSLFDILQVPSTEEPSAPTQTSTVPAESSEALNTPATPNSSSISSLSSGAEHAKVGVDDDEEEQQQQQQQKTKQQLKPKKRSSQKKQREPRFAFMTKSEVDHLEDGYRWRKYGQKAVKNSPFPRSYYRCTTSSCDVKKRVERSFTDPSTVVTTYEGQHTHHSPVMMPRGGNPAAGFPPGFGISAAAFALPFQMTLPHLPEFNNLAPPLNCGYNIMNSTNPNAVHERRFCTTPASAFLRDNGLLQDIVPSVMGKEE